MAFLSCGADNFSMIAIACILLTVAHPGIFFPDMQVRRAKSETHSMEEVK